MHNQWCLKGMPKEQTINQLTQPQNSCDPPYESSGTPKEQCKKKEKEKETAIEKGEKA